MLFEKLLGNYHGLIPLLGGIYVILLATGVLPRKPKNPEQWQLWRRKTRTLFLISGPVMIIMGVCYLFGIW